MKHKALTIFVLALLLFINSCEVIDNYGTIDIKSHHYYKGEFQIINSEYFKGEVWLEITDGKYNCQTNYPFNYGAGYLTVDMQTINFTDTTSHIIPAIYLTGFSLSGEYNYQIVGKHLRVWKKYGNETIMYLLKEENL